jgi:hypothetical protein
MNDGGEDIKQQIKGIIMQISKERCDCTAYDGHDCQFAARYEIDGIKLCSHHAGPIALVRLLALKQASRIEITNKYVKDPLCQLTSIYDKHKNLLKQR